MAERLIGTVEQLTGRKVVTYQSQVLFDPDIVCEFFFFDDQLPPEVIRHTVEALKSPESTVVSSEDDAQ